MYTLKRIYRIYRIYIEYHRKNSDRTKISSWRRLLGTVLLIHDNKMIRIRSTVNAGNAVRVKVLAGFYIH